MKMNITILKDQGVAELNVTLVFWAGGLGLRQLRRSAAAVNSHGIVFSSFIFPPITMTSDPSPIFPV